MGKGISGLDSGMSNVYSSLLGGGTAGGAGASTLLTDYASIKNGSYGKMMKAYYAKQKAEEEAESSDSVSSKSKKIKDDKRFQE